MHAFEDQMVLIAEPHFVPLGELGTAEGRSTAPCQTDDSGRRSLGDGVSKLAVTGLPTR